MSALPSRGLGIRPPLLLLIAAVSCALLLPLVVFGSSRAESTITFAQLGWGNGDNEVGLAEEEEGLTRGPEALAVSPDGRVAILDSVNRRLLLLDGDGAILGRIPLAAAQPGFLAVDDEYLYVLDVDADKELATYSWSGELIGRTSASQVDDVVTGLFATSEGPCVEIAHRESLVLDQPGQGREPASQQGAAQNNVSQQGTSPRLPGRPLGHEMRGFVSATFRPAEGVGLQTHAVNGPGLQTGPPHEIRPSLAKGLAIEHLVSVDPDGHGGLLVGVRLLQPEQCGDTVAALAITRLSAAEVAPGGNAGIQKESDDDLLFLAESDFAYLGPPYVVAPDGGVFQPVASEAGYTLLVHSFGQVAP